MHSLGYLDMQQWRDQWSIRSDTTYLNHGSFGPTPLRVRQQQRHFQDLLEEQPMDFLIRQFEEIWFATRKRLAQFVGCDDDGLVFMENATQAMNQIADGFPLSPGDEVILNDHEYGAVIRIWERACQRAEAAAPVIAELPKRFQTKQQIVDAIFEQVTPQTKLIVVSHVTSSSAIILPVDEICKLAKQSGIAVCVDGPHAPVQVPLDIDQLGCDFYTASLHKWLAAPFGTGFLYVSPHYQDRVVPCQLSWGRIPPTPLETWADEFIWPGTRDPSGFFAIPAAIDFIEEVGVESLRSWSHELVRHARQALYEMWQVEALTPDSTDWYGSMVSVPLPSHVQPTMQQTLWEKDGIEAPFPHAAGQDFIRVSSYLYNDRNDIDKLLTALSP